MQLIKNLPQSCLGNFYLFLSQILGCFSLVTYHQFATEKKLQVDSEAHGNLAQNILADFVCLEMTTDQQCWRNYIVRFLCATHFS